MDRSTCLSYIPYNVFSTQRLQTLGDPQGLPFLGVLELVQQS